MDANFRERAFADLGRVLAERTNLQAHHYQGGKGTYYDIKDIHKIMMLGRAVVERIAGRSSVYVRQLEAILSSKTPDDLKMDQVVGVVESLRADVIANSLEGIAELIHGELFGDFLDMAQHLLDEGFKDAAAVIAGSSLEAHLRQLCDKHRVDIDLLTATGTRPKKADQLNADLVGVGAYSKLDQKNVTAWLDLRNKAAHGQYSQYTKEQVTLMLNGVQDFITRHPA